MHEVTSSLERNIAEIQNLSVFKGFEPAKVLIKDDFYSSLLGKNPCKLFRVNIYELHQSYEKEVS